MNGWITIGSKMDTKQLERDIKDAEKELANYHKQGEKLTDQKAQLEVDIKLKKEDYERKIKEIKEKARIDVEANVGGSYRQRAAKDQKILDTANLKLDAAYQDYTRAIKQSKEELEQVNKKISENKTRLKGAKQEAQGLKDKLANVTALDKLKGKVDGVAGSLKNVASKGDLKGLSSKIQGVGSAVKGITGKIMKWGLALFGIRTAYNFIRQSASTVFQQNEGLKNQVDLMKNTIATALEPLIKNLVSLVYTLFSFINGIVAKLTGKNLFATAQKNLAKGAGSAKEINKQLAGFDEMNVLSDSSGGGGAGGDFDTSGFVDANAKLMEILEKFKKMFEEGDWAGIAQTISAGIISGLTYLTEKIKAIDWKGIGTAISEFLTNIDFSGIFTSFITLAGETMLGIQDMLLAIDWATVFKNFSQAIADSFAKINEYIQKIRWEDIGKTISDVFSSIQWGEIGSNILNAIWSAITGLMDLILAIDWSQVGATIGNAVHEWITTLITIFQETDWMQLGTDIVDAIFDFIEGVDWMQLGIDILLGLAEGIGAMIEFLLGIFNEIIERILDLLGVHSPSTVFADIGKNLIEGLVEGIKGLIQKVIDTFSKMLDNVKTVFNTMLNWIKEKIITPLANFFTGLWNGIKDGVSSAYNFIKNIFQNVVDFFKNIISKVVSVFGTLGGKVGDTISGAFKNVVNSVLGGVEKILNSPIKAINGLISTINAIPGVNIGKLSTFSLPRLAKGGIINQPGKGVMVGSAIAGEKGREGVIPLTDSQQMAILGETIGKYITINANITNTMNGRVISRELQKVQNENDFAFNR